MYISWVHWANICNIERIGKHFDLINSNNTSSDALRSIFPNILYRLLKIPLCFFENEHLKFVELSKYTPRYLADISHLIEWPDTTISAQAFLNRGPKRIHADFPTLIAMSRNSSSEAHISTSDCKAWTHGASKITSSAYKNIAVGYSSRQFCSLYWPYLYTWLSHQ